MTEGKHLFQRKLLSLSTGVCSCEGNHFFLVKVKLLSLSTGLCSRRRSLVTFIITAILADREVDDQDKNLQMDIRVMWKRIEIFTFLVGHEK